MTSAKHSIGKRSEIPMQQTAVLQQFKVLTQGNLAIPVVLMAILGMMILPVPPFLLDLLFTFNIALALVVLLVCVLSLIHI